MTSSVWDCQKCGSAPGDTHRPECGAPLQSEPVGVWFAHYFDYSGFAVFLTEIEALRYAVSNGGMNVEFKPWGELR